MVPAARRKCRREKERLSMFWFTANLVVVGECAAAVAHGGAVTHRRHVIKTPSTVLRTLSELIKPGATADGVGHDVVRVLDDDGQANVRPAARQARGGLEHEAGG